MKDFSISSVLHAMLNKLWLILLVAFLLAAATFVYTSSFVVPVYSSSSSVLISNGGILTEAQYYGKSSTGTNVINASDISASTAIKNTCIDILTTSKMFELVADELNLYHEYTPSDLRDMVTLSTRSDESLVLDITVKGTRQNDLVEIANTFAEVAPDYIKAKLSFAAIDINDYAQSYYKVSPRIAFSTAIAFVLGALMVMIPIFFLTVYDRTIKGEEDFANTYKEIAILGVVPDFMADPKGEYKYNG